MHALGGYLMVKDSEDDLDLRSGVCDAMGNIASAVGGEMFEPYVMELMKASEEALHLDNSRLKESSFILWSSLAKVYEAQFAPFLPGAFKGLFESLELEEEDIALEPTEAEQVTVGLSDEAAARKKKINLRDDEVNDLDIMADEEEDDSEDTLAITNGALEKEVAIEVIGDIITHACGATEVKEYLEKVVEMIVPLAEHSYEGCRKAALSTLWRAYARVWQLMEEETGSQWEPGFPPKQTPTAMLVKLGEIVAKATLQVWIEDGER
jgi:hypothetical protein